MQNKITREELCKRYVLAATGNNEFLINPKYIIRENYPKARVNKIRASLSNRPWRISWGSLDCPVETFGQVQLFINLHTRQEKFDLNEKYLIKHGWNKISSKRKNFVKNMRSMTLELQNLHLRFNDIIIERWELIITSSNRRLVARLWIQNRELFKLAKRLIGYDLLA